LPTKPLLLTLAETLGLTKMNDKEVKIHLQKIGISYNDSVLNWSDSNRIIKIPFDEIKNVKLTSHNLSKGEGFLRQYLAYFFTSWHDEFNHDSSSKNYVLTLTFKSGKKYYNSLKEIDLIFASAAIKSLNQLIKTNPNTA